MGKAPSLKGPFQPAFTRGQMELAIWRMPAANGRSKPPAAFRTKVKYLLELDRNEPLEGPFKWAFFDAPTAGSGEHILFSVFDTVMMFIALGLLGFGFQRNQVVAYLRRRRPRLRKRLAALLTQSLDEAQGAPSAKRKANAEPERLLLAIHDLRNPDASMPKDDGVYSAEEAADAMLANFTYFAVMDITDITRRLPSSLLSAPAFVRGRTRDRTDD